MSTGPKIIILGASGKVGQVLAKRLIGQGKDIIAVGRNADKLTEFPNCRVADVNDNNALRHALADADIIVSCLHARFVPQILNAVTDRTQRIIVMGSTRCFTRFPDDAAHEVKRAEQLIWQDKRAIILHPTMIYGAAAENNVRRIAGYITRFGFVPLPRHGRALVQPVYIDDVVIAIETALSAPLTDRAPIILAGPQAVTYKEFVKAIAAAIDKKVWIAPMPVWLLLLIAPLTRFVPFLPTIKKAEILRLLEDKNFDIAAMRHKLGVTPRSLHDGLALTFKA